MGTQEIPAAYEHVCDGCRATLTAATKSRPAYWSTLTLARDQHDFQGAAVADGTVRRLLCDECSGEVIDAINAALKGRAK